MTVLNEQCKTGLSHQAEKGGTKRNFTLEESYRLKGGLILRRTYRILLISKAFPHLQAEARDQLALTHYLSQIENPQLAFSVKQQKPANLDAAVSATLEMESYLPSKLTTARADLEGITKTENVAAAATTKEDMESTSHLMKQLLERMGRMELELHQSKQTQSPRRKTDLNSQSQRRSPVVCWNCNRPGHIARNCRLQPPQGNANPYTD